MSITILRSLDFYFYGDGVSSSVTIDITKAPYNLDLGGATIESANIVSGAAISVSVSRTSFTFTFSSPPSIGQNVTTSINYFLSQ